MLLLTLLAIVLCIRETQPLQNFGTIPYFKYGYPPSGLVNREQAKLKVDLLGSLLKKHVSKLRGENLEADLVFLVDSSASVGADNFYNEIKFIRKLLADFTVSVNTTRVVIITYSSVNQVIRQVDHMSRPRDTKHKCSLFEEEIPVITYNSGGTYTLGALLEAQDVFRFSRPTAKKAVFLITDGYSNGGDPRPAAERLKALGVEFYTFGIRNGNVKELFDMASEPRAEHSFIVDSFEEFEALARRALHKDLGGTMYLNQEAVRCSKLCTDGDCCDRQATCSCGAHSGFYSCICPRGFYGRGLKGDCHKCPAGTYKPRLEPGDMRACLPCPGNNQISPPGSYSPLQCHCKEGYTLRNGECQAMDCPPLSPPENGYFIRNECHNVFNAACGVRCNSGYQLLGDSIRLCLPTGEWSGQPAHCVVKTCRPLKPPAFGHVTCTTNTHQVDTVCTFGCNHGYKLVGSRSRVCLPISLWGGLPAFCKPITCPPLRKPSYGLIYPADCSTKRSHYGGQCAFACNPGFQLYGPAFRECKGRGRWTGGPVLSRCVDVEPPKITCPANQTVAVDKHSYWVRVDWDPPRYSDNSGFFPLVTSVPSLEPPTKLKIGRHIIKYNAEDLSGNKIFCIFEINVVDLEPPVVDYCESPPEFITDTEDVDIDWDEPIFHDNSRGQVTIAKSHEFGRFKFGSTDVVYKATDPSGNLATCTITVTLQRHLCSLPNDPINGHSNCSESAHAVHCTLACDSGFAFAFKPTGDYFCETSGPGLWQPQHNVLPFPDCSVAALSSVVSLPTDLRVSLMPSNKEDEVGLCDDTFFLKQVANHVRDRVLKQLDNVCGNSLYCDIKDLEAICGDILDNRNVYSNEIYRRKRAVQSGRDYRLHDDSFARSVATSAGHSPVDISHGPRGHTVLAAKHGSSDRSVASIGRSSDLDDLQSFAISTNANGKRQVIEVFFKLIGSFKEEIKQSQEQDGFLQEISSLRVGLEDSASSGNLDLDIGDRLAVVEEVMYGEEAFECPPGAVPLGNVCVNCPVGTFYNVMENECTPCPAGTYQNKEAQKTCMVCPGGTFTKISSGATHPSECKAQCLPGSVSSDGLERCQTCPMGQFQPRYAQLECEACPPGTRTLYRGASKSKECLELCSPGKSSETGLEPCFPCPKGYFQPDSGQMHCYRCPEKRSTKYISTTSLEGCIGLDSSTIYDITSLETLDVNDCFSLPCQNGGSCVALSQGFYCSCGAGFTGSYCQVKLDLCQSQPCLNQGVCTSEGGKYECECPTSFIGMNCEIRVSSCDHHKCQNNATCIEPDITENSYSKYKCECDDGYEGEFCEINIDDCESHGCENDGVCIDGIGTFRCDCPLGFKGRLCEEEEDDCADQPCGLGATCIDGINSFRCVCPAGLTGQRCEEQVDLCSPGPCHGSATCISTRGHFHCVCPPSYSGRLCQNQILPNFVLTFGNSPSTETLDYVILDQIHTPIDQLSITFWMRSDDKDNYGTPFSYATANQDNELTVTDYNGFVVSVKGRKVVTDVTANDGHWHFIAVTWESLYGEWNIYRDGQLMDSGEGLATGLYIEEGGIVIIGQEQDVRGDDFSAAESFRGSMTRLDLWSRALSAEEIVELKTSCSPYYGDIIAYPDVYRGLRGQLRISDLDLCQTCSQLEAPVNGNVKITGSRSNRTGEFSCRDGYYLEGAEVSSCNIFGEWEAETPMCKIVNCGFPGYLEHGTVEGNSYMFQDSVTFSCHPGYRLEGAAKQTCGANAKWGPKRPKCAEIRCDVPQPVKNSHYASDPRNRSLAIGSRLELACEPGYEMDGLAELECQPDGSWSDMLPVCQPVPCSQPPVVQNGYIAGGLPDVLDQGVLLTYNCDPGYEILDVDTVLCGSNGAWTRPMPKCSPVVCPPPKNVPNGRTSFGGTSYGEIANYKCKKGHYLIGPLNSTCTEIGVWSPPPPTCVPVDCLEPETVEDGSVAYEGTTYKNVATYTCDPGFNLKGTDVRVCTSSGFWSKSAPECFPAKCTDPGQLPLGYFLKNDSYSAGEVAVAECLSGHKLVQSEPFVCDSAGNWQGSPPICIPKLCIGPGSIPHGSLLIGTWSQEPLGEESIKVLENEIYEKRNSSQDMSIILEKSNQVLNGQNLIYYPVGSEVWMDCVTGYFMEGEQVNTCVDENEWTYPFPACKQIYCPQIQNILNGKIDVEGFKYGLTAFYSCDEGYTLVGNDMRICLENGSWSGENPFCVPKLCPEPVEIENGMLDEILSIEYGAVITYRCKPDFQLIGGSERVCGHTGHWSGHLPICANSTQLCLAPTLIESGYVAYDSELLIGSTAWYDCFPEFMLRGDSQRTCLSNGTWSSDQPSCHPKDCQPITYIPNGQVIGNVFEPESALQFSCNIGYQLIGNSTILCNEAGEWNSPEPACVPVFCNKPHRLENGMIKGSAWRYGDSVVAECDEGYTLMGSKVRRCGYDGKWSDTEPHCALISCPEIGNIDHGSSMTHLRVPGEIARFRCDIGWTLQGSSEMLCTHEGRWEGNPPKCIPVVCLLDQRQLEPHPVQVKKVVNAGQSIDWQCPVNKQLIGSNRTTCLPNGEWDKQPPRCEHVECKDILKLDNGVIFGRKNYSMSSIEVNFSCDNGYFKIVDSFLECEENGKWKGDVPLCSRRHCGPIPHVDHAEKVIRSQGISYYVEYTCHKRFELQGSSKIHCRSDNSWSSKFPSCIKAYCPQIPQLSKMIYPSDRIHLGETVKFACHKGYSLDGPNFVKCTESGNYDKRFPRCIPETCQFPKRVRHGHWNVIHSQYKKELWMNDIVLPIKETKNDAEIYVGDHLEVKCDRRYEVYGESLILCNDHLRLNAEFPKCKRSHCSKVPVLENGSVNYNGTYKGATLSYSCNKGYTLEGPEARKCKRNKEWSKFPPECKIVKCPIPYNIAHGHVDFNPENLFYGSTASFFCHTGFELVGNFQRSCGPDGAWDGAEPECVRIRCVPPKVPLHGEQDVHDLAVGGTVTYSCNPGYKLEGNRVLTCLANKTWSNNVPVCEKIACTLPRRIPNGKVHFVETNYHASIEYKCDEGFTLVGLRTRSCLHTGFWSGEDPTCVASRCPKVRIPNGWVRYDGDLPGDRAIVNCLQGFQVSGVSQIVCHSSLSWIPDLPSCLPVSCGQPPTVPFSKADIEGFSYMSRVTYSCIPGYEIRGNEEVFCSSNGSWDGELPSCFPRPCGHPPTIPNSNIAFHANSGYHLGYGSRATYECEAGFVAAGQSLLTCSINSTWQGEVYACLQVPCGTPPAPRHGSVGLEFVNNQYRAEYTCDPGYRLVGTRDIVCSQHDNRWEFAMQECVPVLCPPLPEIANGQLVATQAGQDRPRQYGTVVKLVCDAGYMPLDQNLIETSCTSEGVWSNIGVASDGSGQDSSKLGCQVAKCHQIKPPLHGKVSYNSPAFQQTTYPIQNSTTLNEARLMVWGTAAHFTCNDGYQLFGSNGSTCLKNQTWTEVTPQCQRVWCSSVDAPLNTFLMGVGRQWGDVVRFSCQEGYRMFGEHQMTCLHTGKWSSSPPSCHKVWCNMPQLPHGQVVAGSVSLASSNNNTGFPYKSRLELACRPGYSPRGEMSIHCQANARWSRPDGACHRVSCGRPAADHGVTFLTQTFLYGSRVPFICPSGHYPMNSPLMCMPDGMWSHRAQCIKISR